MADATTVRMSERAYQELALRQPDGFWELWGDGPRQKPAMTYAHNVVPRTLRDILLEQLPRREFVIAETAKLRTRDGHYFIPDLCVFPRVLQTPLREKPRTFEVYSPPVSLVVEVWSPSTGEYDVEKKFPEYRARGDEEIWRVHPYDLTVTVWRKQASGSYTETLYRAGDTMHVMSLPNVQIVLDELFE